MALLLIAEHDASGLKLATLQALTAAQAMDAQVDVLVAGADVGAAVAAAQALPGVRSVLSATVPALAHEVPEVLADVVLGVASQYSALLWTSSSLGKATMPRVAAKLDVSPVSEIIEVVGPKTFKRAMYAGSLIATVEVTDAIVVATVRATSFDAAAATGGSASVTTLAAPAENTQTQFVKFEGVSSDRPDLASAKIVLGGGIGLNDEAGFTQMEALADQMGAAVGATRAAVDANLCPNEWQVGQTGKAIAPQLYIAFGISGAIQHLAGIKDAKTIVAINKDAEAPIFEVADFGLVADAKESIEALKKLLA